MSLGKILIRADACVDIGTGHVMRCLALAQAWQDAGGSAVFALAKSTAAILKRLAAEGFETFAVGAEPGCAEDADLTARLGVHHSVRWTVLDGYLFDGEYQQRVKDGGSRLLCVDDNADARRFCADVILNQNLHASVSMYGERMDGSSLLLGPSYALLRREFNGLRDWKREFDSPARTVLVMMGGSDPQNLSAVAIESLRKLGRSEMNATVVAGGSNLHIEELRQQARKSKVNIQVVVDAPDLPRLIQSADLAISAAGSTCWEICMLGLPAIVIDAAPNQLPIARELDRRLMAIHIPRAQATAIHLAAKIDAILNAPEVLRRMSQRASAAVDGKGSQRVVAAMRGHGMTMRPAQAADCSLLWRWTNDPAVRKASFSSAEIPWEAHTFWFAQRMADPGSTFLIFEEESEPVGCVRFQSSSMADTEIGVTLGPQFRQCGLAPRLLDRATEHAFEQGTAQRVHAYIKLDNPASARSFERAGFSLIGTTRVKENEALHYVRERKTGDGALLPRSHPADEMARCK